MELNLTQNMRKLLLAFFLLILPWLFIIIGIGVDVESKIGPGWTAIYYLLSIIWFGMGVIFYSAMN